MKKTVVHSSNGTVTWPRLNGSDVRVTTMFHSQPVDYERKVRVGTFFTNLAEGPVIAALGRTADTTCTDLSTIGVDKDESPLPTATCVSFVTKARALGCNS